MKHQDGLHDRLGGGIARADCVQEVAWPDHHCDTIAVINIEDISGAYGIFEFEASLVSADPNGLYGANSSFQWNTAIPFQTRWNSLAAME